MQMAAWERMALEALLEALYDASGTLAALLASSSGEADTARVRALIRHESEVWHRVAAEAIASGGADLYPAAAQEASQGGEATAPAACP